ncbi:PAS domain S-box protein [Cellvibrio sp.]|uniref:PAS domain S-box protein n=1 Tax=Cellvibrio sp. TaxID=1965322 RepID=UPI0039647942
MNAPVNTYGTPHTYGTPKTIWVVASIAISLFCLGISVIFAWHNPSAFGENQIVIVRMAYNTAVCIFLSSISLFFVLTRQFFLLKICALIMAILSGAKLLQVATGVNLDGDYWLISQSNAVKINGQTMAPASAFCIAIISLSLLLLRQDLLRTIPTVFLNLINIIVTLVALVGNGVGSIPAFVWLGIKMAPHTALGLSLFSIAITLYLYKPTVDAFNQLNFFKRIVSGFAFMAVLVVGIGSIAIMQIQTVSNLAHELYENPLKTSNTSQRIKNDIESLNRLLKNVAVEKAIAEFQDVPSAISKTEKRFQDAVQSIHDTSLNRDIEKLTANFNAWITFTQISWAALEKGDIETFSSRTVYEGQEYVLSMEETLEKISYQSQQNIAGINNSVARIETQAKQLVIIFVIGFLIAGLLVTSLITRSLTSQLKKIQETMTAIAHENEAQEIPYLEHKEEMGEMARTLSVFQDSLLARRELEARLLQVIEAMPTGIIMVNTDGVIEIVNAQAEKIFGHNRSELLNNKVEKLIPSGAAKAHAENRNNFFSNPSPRQMGAGRELCGLHRDGTEFPIEIGLAPLQTNSGLKVLASIVDITERRKVEKALNESREKLEITTRINQIGVWEYIVKEGTLIWNETMFEIYGRKKNYFTADYKAWKQNIHPSDIENAERQFQNAIKNLGSFDCKYRIIQPDGTIKYLHAKAKIEHKDKVRVLGTCIDVTREELALAKIHDLEMLRSAIVEFSEDAIISKTPTGIITSWNLGAVNMFGFTAEETIGKPIRDLLFPHDLIYEEENLLSQVRAGLVIKHFETRRLCKDGRVINVSITLSPIKDASGNIIGVSAINRDITEIIKTASMLANRKAELERSNHELERSNKELETFAYVASHDLKSPLRGIAQLSTWIEEDLASNEIPTVIEHTHLLRNRIQRMEKLLDDLLIFYRAGKTEGQLVNIDANQMATDIFDIQNTKPGLKLEILNKLPTFITLSTPFELIIRNLFSNAIKHHDKNEGLIQISSKELDSQYFEFTVCDDGPGIPEKFHKRVFGMFQTLKPRDELEGSGMGLALIKKLVETYGGYITLKSSGRGTCFSFSWPQHIQRRAEND